MTRIYDALRIAEATRQQRSAQPVGQPRTLADLFSEPRFAPLAEAESAVPTCAVAPVAAGTPAAGATGHEPDPLREIDCGAPPSDFETAVQQIEAQLDREQEQLCTEIAGLGQRLERRLAEIDARMTRGQTELRDQVLALTHELCASSESRNDGVLEIANEALQHLRHEKLEESLLTGCLHELAARIEGKSAPA